MVRNRGTLRAGIRSDGGAQSHCRCRSATRQQTDVEQVKVEAREIGIIVMDMWDSHWDRTLARAQRRHRAADEPVPADARAAGSDCDLPTGLMGGRSMASQGSGSLVKDLPDAPIPPNNSFQSPEPQMWL